MFHVEYQYIWRAQFKITTILFLLLRYFTFVAIGMCTWLFFWVRRKEQLQRPPEAEAGPLPGRATADRVR